MTSSSRSSRSMCRRKLAQGALRLRQICALPLAQLTGMRHELLGAGNFRADFVVAPLHRRHLFALLGVQGALFLQRRLRAALLGELPPASQVRARARALSCTCAPLSSSRSRNASSSAVSKRSRAFSA